MPLFVVFHFIVISLRSRLPQSFMSVAQTFTSMFANFDMCIKLFPGGRYLQYTS